MPNTNYSTSGLSQVIKNAIDGFNSIHSAISGLSLPTESGETRGVIGLGNSSNQTQVSLYPTIISEQLQLIPDDYQVTLTAKTGSLMVNGKAPYSGYTIRSVNGLSITGVDATTSEIVSIGSTPIKIEDIDHYSISSHISAKLKANLSGWYDGTETALNTSGKATNVVGYIPGATFKVTGKTFSSVKAGYVPAGAILAEASIGKISINRSNSLTYNNGGSATLFPTTDGSKSITNADDYYKLVFNSTSSVGSDFTAGWIAKSSDVTHNASTAKNVFIKKGSAVVSTPTNLNTSPSAAFAPNQEVTINPGYYENPLVYNVDLSDTTATVADIRVGKKVWIGNTLTEGTAGNWTPTSSYYTSTNTGFGPIPTNRFTPTAAYYIKSATAEATIVGQSSSATFTPVISTNGIAVENAVNLGGSASSTAPTSGYFIAVQSASQAGKELTPKINVTSAGWINGSKNGTKVTISLGSSAVTYIPVKGGTLKNVSTSGITYKEIARADVLDNIGELNDGYLYINEGWLPNTKIKLGDLLPDITNDALAEYILAGYKAYDEAGNIITGALQTLTQEYILTSQGEVQTISTGYHDGTTVKVNLPIATYSSDVKSTGYGTAASESNPLVSAAPGSNYYAIQPEVKVYEPGYSGAANVQIQQESLKRYLKRGGVSDTSLGYGESSVITSGYIPNDVTVTNAIGAGKVDIENGTINLTQLNFSSSGSGYSVSLNIGEGSIQRTPRVVTAGYLSRTVGTKTAGTISINTSSITVPAASVTGGGLKFTNSTTASPTDDKGNAKVLANASSGYVLVNVAREDVTTTTGYIEAKTPISGATLGVKVAAVKNGLLTVDVPSPSGTSFGAGTVTIFDSTTGAKSTNPVYYGTTTVTIPEGTNSGLTNNKDKYIISGETVKTKSKSFTVTANINTDTTGSNVDSALESLYKCILGVNYNAVTI